MTFIIEEKLPTGLVAAVGHTRVFEPHEIGTAVQAQEVSASAQKLLHESGIRKESVHMILIKCPLLTSEKVEKIKAASKVPVTTDTYESMAKSRYASAVGIAIALEELEETRLDEAISEESFWSGKARCSSGAELEDCHILVIASDPLLGNLRAISGHMDDAIDAQAIFHMLEQVKREHGEVLHVFAKAEADPRGKIRGKRHTMNTDSDIQSTRHARAAVGGLIGGLVGDTQVRSLCSLLYPAAVRRR